MLSSAAVYMQREWIHFGGSLSRVHFLAPDWIRRQGNSDQSGESSFAIHESCAFESAHTVSLRAERNEVNQKGLIILLVLTVGSYNLVGVNRV